MRNFLWEEVEEGKGSTQSIGRCLQSEWTLGDYGLVEPETRPVSSRGWIIEQIQAIPF